jgi:hypothetical protein
MTEFEHDEVYFKCVVCCYGFRRGEGLIKANQLYPVKCSAHPKARLFPIPTSELFDGAKDSNGRLLRRRKVR